MAQGADQSTIDICTVQARVPDHSQLHIHHCRCRHLWLCVCCPFDCPKRSLLPPLSVSTPVTTRPHLYTPTLLKPYPWTGVVRTLFSNPLTLADTLSVDQGFAKVNSVIFNKAHTGVSVPLTKTGGRRGQAAFPFDLQGQNAEVSLIFVLFFASTSGS